MDYYTKVLLLSALLLILSVVAIYAVGNGGLRRDTRQGGKLIDARLREGYTYTNPQRTAARTLSLDDPEGVYYATDAARMGVRTSRKGADAAIYWTRGN
jgi:hypothetical protein